MPVWLHPIPWLHLALPAKACRDLAFGGAEKQPQGGLGWAHRQAGRGLETLAEARMLRAPSQHRRQDYIHLQSSAAGSFGLLGRPPAPSAGVGLRTTTIHSHPHQTSHTCHGENRGLLMAQVRHRVHLPHFKPSSQSTSRPIPPKNGYCHCCCCPLLKGHISLGPWREVLHHTTASLCSFSFHCSRRQLGFTLLTQK